MTWMRILRNFISALLNLVHRKLHNLDKLTAHGITHGPCPDESDPLRFSAWTYSSEKKNKKGSHYGPVEQTS